MTLPNPTRESEQISNIPVPDPSVLTLEYMRDGLSNLRDLMEIRIAAIGRELAEFRSGHEEKHVSVVDAAILHRKLLTEANIAAIREQIEAVVRAGEAGTESLNREIDVRFDSTDLRYQQRYDAQTQALEAAFQAQQEATAAALAAAKEAVQTALTSSEKAVSKAEMAVAKLIPRAEVEARIADMARQAQIAGATVDARLSELASVVSAHEGLSDRVEKANEGVHALDRVTDAKFVTFRTLIDSQADKVALALAASDKAVEAAFASSAAAIGKAETFNEKRFDIITKQIDELRAYQASDAGRTSVADPAIERAMGEYRAEIQSLRESRSEGRGKSGGMNASWGYLVAALGIIILVVNFGIAIASK